MKTLASSLLISVAIVGIATTMNRPAAVQGDGRSSSLPSQWIARDPITSPPALAQRFGRDTLLYFPMQARQPNPPVAFAVTGAFQR
jgi:hypothetical protein